MDLRWEELSLRSDLLEIPAPISGTLVNVYCWPGQIVAPGGLIATIAADHGQHIVGYVPEQSTIVPKVGMQVTMRARMARSPRITSTIEEVGKQIQQLPSHQRAVANLPQWGLPVRIKMPPDASLRPGSLVDIVFRRPAPDKIRSPGPSPGPGEGMPAPRISCSWPVDGQGGRKSSQLSGGPSSAYPSLAVHTRNVSATRSATGPVPR